MREGWWERAGVGWWQEGRAASAALHVRLPLCKRPAAAADVRFPVLLQLLLHCVKHRWNGWPDEAKAQFKESVFAVFESGTAGILAEAHFLKGKVAELTVEIAKREWCVCGRGGLKTYKSSKEKRLSTTTSA